MSTATAALDRVVAEALGHETTWPSDRTELSESERDYVDRAAAAHGITPDAMLSLIHERTTRMAEARATVAAIRARR